MRSIGARRAVDDVGFGRTSLETLLVLEPEVIKIDAAEVDGIAPRREREAWLERLVRVAAALDATVIAEGIETRRDSDVIASLGVELGQGCFYGRPVPVALATTG